MEYKVTRGIILITQKFSDTWSWGKLKCTTTFSPAFLLEYPQFADSPSPRDTLMTIFLETLIHTSYSFILFTYIPCTSFSGVSIGLYHKSNQKLCLSHLRPLNQERLSPLPWGHRDWKWKYNINVLNLIYCPTHKVYFKTCFYLSPRIFFYCFGF